MTKLNLIALYIWSALAFAVAAKSQVHKPYSEWFKFGLRVVQQQPVSLDLRHALLALDPEGRWLHGVAGLLA